MAHSQSQNASHVPADCCRRVFDLDTYDAHDRTWRVDWIGPTSLFEAERALGFPSLKPVMPYAPGAEGRYSMVGIWSDPVEVETLAQSCGMMVARLHGAAEIMVLVPHGYIRSDKGVAYRDAGFHE